MVDRNSAKTVETTRGDTVVSGSMDLEYYESSLVGDPCLDCGITSVLCRRSGGHQRNVATVHSVDFDSILLSLKSILCHSQGLP